MASDSGYRIRLELLELARGILSEKQTLSFELDVKRGNTRKITPYSSEDVIKEAEKLYKFVQKK